MDQGSTPCISTVLSLVCDHCSEVFQRPNYQVNQHKKHLFKKVFCGRKCQSASQVQASLTKCSQCDTPMTLPPYRKKRVKGNQNFCGHACSAQYYQVHGKHKGFRRSKLEVWLEKELRNQIPNLEIQCNGREAVGMELDFYFPELKMAIELNGPLHYFPIHGESDLLKRMELDRKKRTQCENHGVILHVIDVSKERKTTEDAYSPYLERVKSLIHLGV